MKTVKSVALEAVAMMAALSVTCVSRAETGTATVSVADRVMTVNGTGSLADSLTDEQLASVTDNTVTNITVVNTSGRLVLDTDLSAYKGSWTLKGKVDIAVAGAMGTSDADDETAGEIVIYKSPNKGQIHASVSTPIDKPVRTVGTFDPWNVLEVRNTEMTFNRKVTFGCSGQLYLGGGDAKMYFKAGFDADGYDVTTVGANGYIYIQNVPCRIGMFYFNWVSLKLQVAGNKIKKFNFQNQGNGLFIEADGALSGYLSEIVNIGGDQTYVNLKGHDTAFGNISGMNGKGYFATTAGTTATLTVSNSQDIVFKPRFLNGISLKKMGEGKLTVDRSLESTGGLEVNEGCVEFTENGTWKNCSGVELTGGTLVIADSDRFPESLALSVTGEESSLELSDDACLPVGSLSIDGVAAASGFYGDADSMKSLGFLGGDGTGVLVVPNVLTVEIATGETKTLTEALTEAQMTALAAGDYTKISKTGDGILVLDKALEYAGMWEINGGKVQVTAQEKAFGEAIVPDLATVSVNSSSTVSIGLLLGVKDQKTEIERPINALGRTDLTIEGEVRCREEVRIGDYTWFTVRNGHFYPDGGLFIGGDINYQAAGTSVISITNKPIHMKMFNPVWSTVHLYVPSNTVKEYVQIRDNTTLRLHCDDAFKAPFPQLWMKPTANGTPKLQLGGHTLCVGNMQLVGESANVSTGNKGKSVIDSNEGPGVLSFVQTTDFTNSKVKVKGMVSLVKGGAKPFTFNIPIESTGTLTVTGGVFAMTAEADWAGCTNVTISGEGAVVEARKNDTFAKRAEFEISDGGKLHLPESGSVQHASYLFIDDALQFGGTWGSSESPAKHKDDVHFSGPGVLSVLGNIGTVMVIR